MSDPIHDWFWIAGRYVRELADFHPEVSFDDQAWPPVWSLVVHQFDLADRTDGDQIGPIETDGRPSELIVMVDKEAMKSSDAASSLDVEPFELAPMGSAAWEEKSENRAWIAELVRHVGLDREPDFEFPDWVRQLGEKVGEVEDRDPHPDVTVSALDGEVPDLSPLKLDFGTYW